MVCPSITFASWSKSSTCDNCMRAGHRPCWTSRKEAEPVPAQAIKIFRDSTIEGGEAMEGYLKRALANGTDQ
jgi:hypothetical protein